MNFLTEYSVPVYKCPPLDPIRDTCIQTTFTSYLTTILSVFPAAPNLSHLRLIHTYHAVPLPYRANSHIPRCAPAILRQCYVLRESPRLAGKPELPIVKLRVVVGRNRTWANRPQAVEKHGIVYVNQTRSHCVMQMRRTQSKLLATRTGMCELAFTLPPALGISRRVQS